MALSCVANCKWFEFSLNQGFFMRFLFVALSVLFISLPFGHADESVTIKRRAGLWEVAATTDSQTSPSVIKQCADEATDAKMMQMMSKSQHAKCSLNRISKIDSGYSLASECVMSGSTMKSNGEFVGNFETEYSGKIETLFEPPLFGVSKSKTTMSAKWMGPCPADMVVGDLMMENGLKLNINQAEQQAKQAAAMLESPEFGKLMKGDGMNPQQLREALNGLAEKGK